MKELVFPAVNLFGSDCIKELGRIIDMFHGTKALIITDRNLEKIGMAKKIEDILDEIPINHELYPEVCPNPTKENVYAGLSVFKSAGCDFIIGIGGGSPNDCSKAVGILAANGGKIEDYEGGNKSSSPSVPLILINTTAGTGSEISRAYLISDEQKSVKIIAKDMHALPFCSMNDPLLMTGLPTLVTGSTGMDALSHAVESYVSNGAYTLTREIALSACRLIFSSLQKVVADPKNVDLRERMIYAEFLAALAFGNSGVGIDHSLSHALGATCNLPHGLCCAIFLPPVIHYNRRNAQANAAYSDLGRNLFPIQCNGKDDEYCADLLEDEITQLSENVGTLRSLSSLGCVEKSMFTEIAEKALKDGNTQRNPIPDPSIEDLISIIEKVW